MFPIKRVIGLYLSWNDLIIMKLKSNLCFFANPWDQEYYSVAQGTHKVPRVRVVA